MPKTIWKFLLEPNGVTKMPAGAEVLSVQMQDDHPVVWAMVNPDEMTVVTQLGVYGTGHTVPDDPGQFIGTFQMQDGALVFHVFQPDG